MTFMKIKAAVRETGLSEHFLREGCKSGEVPHIKSGRTYYIDIESLLKKIRSEN